jgi:hypothetical protein
VGQGEVCCGSGEQLGQRDRVATAGPAVNSDQDVGEHIVSFGLAA